METQAAGKKWGRWEIGIVVLLVISALFWLSVLGGDSSALRQGAEQTQGTDLAEMPESEREAFYATPAGELCKAHPDWEKEECELLVQNKIWIGMTYDMLVYVNGKPDSMNTSNYGDGIQQQYCWRNTNPDCFYDKNNDGIIDAYN